MTCECSYNVIWNVSGPYSILQQMLRFLHPRFLQEICFLAYRCTLYRCIEVATILKIEIFPISRKSNNFLMTAATVVHFKLWFESCKASHPINHFLREIFKLYFLVSVSFKMMIKFQYFFVVLNFFAKIHS